MESSARAGLIDIDAGLGGIDADVYLHALDIDSPASAVGVASDELVVTASTFKVFVLLELALQAAEGRLALTDRITVPAGRRSVGPTGISRMLDDVDVSLRDLAFWMMCVSDNTATDVIQEKVGTDAVNARLRSLGLRQSALVDDCAGLIATVGEDLGEPDAERWAEAITAEALAANRSLCAETTNRTSPREMSELLARVWRDDAGPPEACAEVRRIMALQVWPHRLSSGFDPGVQVSGKTGTLLTVRNEVGVVEYPDGGRYAVSVFLRTSRWESRQPASDAAIGRLGRLAVDALR